VHFFFGGVDESVNGARWHVHALSLTERYLTILELELGTAAENKKVLTCFGVEVLSFA
jgi:hypothetical protein